jgi:hypothetical protein
MQTFSFNQPGLTVLLIFFVLLVLLYPFVQLRRGPEGTSLRDRIFSWWPGAPSLVVMVLVVVSELFLFVDSYSSFWTLTVDRDHIVLDYWFPRSDRRVDVADIRAIHVTRVHYDAGVRGVEDRLTLALLTTGGEELKSIMILDDEKGLAAANAVAEVSGGSPQFFYREGRFGETSPTERLSPPTASR